MLIDYQAGQTGIILRVKIRNSSVTTGGGLTGLTNSSSGLLISTIADSEAAATAYTATGATIDTIATLGTYAAPTSGHCRFKELDPTNHPGIYELQIANARFAVSGCKSLLVSISGATNAAECDAVIPLRAVNPYSATFGLSGVTVAGYASGQDPATLVLDVAASGHNTAGTIGAKINAAASAGDPWSTSLPGSYSAGTAGAIVGTLAFDGSGNVKSTPQTAVTVGTIDANAITNTSIAAAALTGKGDWSTLTAGGVWDQVTTGHATPGTFGAAMIAAANAGDPWAATLPGSYASGTAGNLVGNHLDATVSSRLATSGYTAPPSAASVATAVWTDTTSSDFTAVGSPGHLLDATLDTNIGSRMASFTLPTNFAMLAIDGSGHVTAGALATGAITASSIAAAALTGKGDWLLASSYTAGPSAATIAAAVLTDTTDTTTAGSLGYLLGHAPSWYTAPDNSDVAAIKAQTDKLVFDGSSNLHSTPQTAVTVATLGSGVITASTIAAAALTGKGDWLLAGSYGTPPTAAQIATAVWTDTTSSDFTANGSPGKVLTTNLDAAVSSRSTYAGGPVSSVTAAVTVGTNQDKTGYALTVTPPTAVQMAAAVWQDTTAGDFTVAGSPGHILTTNLDAAISGVSTYAGSDTPGTTTLLARLTSQRGANLDNLDAAVSSRSTYAGGAVASVTGNVGGNVAGSVGSVTGSVGSVTGAVGSVTAAVTVGTITDKAGYSLAAGGLDAIPITDPGGVGGQTTFPKILIALYRRFFRQTTLTGTQLKTYADDGTTVNTTQAVADNGVTQTIGAAQ